MTNRRACRSDTVLVGLLIFAGCHGTAAGRATGAAGQSGSGTGGTAGTSVTVESGDSVLMHHKNLSRDGVYVQPAFKKSAITSGLDKDPGFTSALGAGEEVYAQALFVDNAAGPGAGGASGTGHDLVIVATESDNVYALDALSGTVVWMRNLGAPVALANLPCGNIDTNGITGTPVIDFATRTLFVDAVTTPDGGTTVKHLVFALSIDDGTVQTGWPLDVSAKVPAAGGASSFNSAPQSQRGALAVLNGTVYVPFGGLYGDCGDYHGWLVAVSIADPTKIQAWATTAGAGGIWGPSGVASDGASLFVTTGNTFSTTVWGGGEGLLRFAPGPSFAMPAYWAATNWTDLDNRDLDIGGTGPIVFDLPGATPSALAIAFGKDGNAYLLNRNNLPGVGAPLAMTSVASNQIINAAVVYATATATYATYRGGGKLCTSGSGSIATIKIVPGAPPTIAGSWCADAGNGSPMVTTSNGHADAIVWVPGAEGNNLLNAFDGDSGAAITYPGHSVTIPNMRRYNTPIAAKGRIYVVADSAVVAFKLN